MKTLVLSLSVFLGLSLFSGCVTMKTWPDHEKSATNKIIIIEEKIRDGLQSGTLSTEQSETFLTTLQGIESDYAELKNKSVYREKWDSLQVRLDFLGKELDHQALTRPPRMVAPGS